MTDDERKGFLKALKMIHEWTEVFPGLDSETLSGMIEASILTVQNIEDR